MEALNKRFFYNCPKYKLLFEGLVLGIGLTLRINQVIIRTFRVTSHAFIEKRSLSQTFLNPLIIQELIFCIAFFITFFYFTLLLKKDFKTKPNSINVNENFFNMKTYNELF